MKAGRRLSKSPRQSQAEEPQTEGSTRPFGPEVINAGCFLKGKCRPQHKRTGLWEKVQRLKFLTTEMQTLLHAGPSSPGNL